MKPRRLRDNGHHGAAHLGGQELRAFRRIAVDQFDEFVAVPTSLLTHVQASRENVAVFTSG